MFIKNLVNNKKKHKIYIKIRRDFNLSTMTLEFDEFES